jgi:hypothetical protein
MPQDEEVVVKAGLWHYAGEIAAQVTIVRRPVTFGSGDYEDPPEIGEDRTAPCFVIHWGRPGEPTKSDASSAQHATLDEAIREAESLAPGVKWT